MGIKEIIEAKRLAEAASKVQTASKVQVKVEVKEEIKTVADPVKVEEAIIMPGKPMSFLEKMALKKFSVAPSVVAQTGLNPAIATSETLPKSFEKTDVGQGIIPAANSIANPIELEAEQAYADISVRIEALNSMSETDLSSAMSELKKALLANPSAMALMHDTDYGKMVVALYKLVQEDVVEAIKDKKDGRKSKKVDLTNAAQVEAVFNEL